jgi:hypothetical protein
MPVLAKSPQVRFDAQRFAIAQALRVAVRNTPDRVAAFGRNVALAPNKGRNRMNVNNANNAGHVNGEPPPPVPAPNGAPAAVAAAGFEPGHPLAPRAFQLVGNDATREIARYVSPQDRLNMAASQRAARGDLAPMLPSARRTVAAGEATSLASFQSILDATTLAASAAPNPDEVHGRFETMSALARQVQRLPQREQIGAFEAFRDALAGPAGLDLAVDLAALRRDIALGLESNLHDVASSGVNVARLVEFLGITDIGHINELQLIAVRRSQQPESAWAAVTSGRHVAEVAAEFGITHPDAMQELERAQIESTNPASAGFAVRAGGHVGELAQQHGISTLDGLFCLQMTAVRSDHRESAGTAVRAGRHVGEIATAFGITDPNLIYELERLQIESASPTSAGFAARAGGNVGALAQQHGITTDSGIYYLQRAAVYSNDPESAGTAARAGRRVGEIATAFGITHPDVIHQLELLQIESTSPASVGFAVRAGGDVRTLAQQHGITTEAGLYDLQRAVFNHSASPAVMNGEDVHAVIQQYGIVDPWLISRLEDAAAMYQAALAMDTGGASHARDAGGGKGDGKGAP